MRETDPPAPGPAIADALTTFTTQGGAPFALPPKGAAWEVVEGRVEVYLVSESGRHFLAALSPGSALLSGPEQAGLELQLVTLDAAKLHPVAAGDARFVARARAWLATLGQPADEDGDLVAQASAALARRANEFAGARAAQDTRDVARLSSRPAAAQDPGRYITTALETLCLALGQDRPALDLPGDPGAAQIPDLCRSAGLLARGVRLAGGWHRQDHGPLLARPKRNRGAVEALLWDGRRYRDARGARLTDDAAAGYDLQAYSITVPLPDGVAGFPSLALFIMRGIETRDLRLAGLIAAVMAGIGVLTPLATVWLLSDIVPSGNLGLLAAVGLALGWTGLFSALLQTAQSRAMARIAGRGTSLLFSATSDRLLRLHSHFFKGYAPGDLNQRLGHLEQMRGLFVSVAFGVVVTAMLSAVYLAVLLSYDAQLAAIGIGLVLVYIVAVVIARLLQLGPIRRAAELDGEVAALTYETLDGVAKLRASAAEERATARWLRVYAKERDANVSAGRISVGFGAFSDAYQTATLMTLFGGAAALTAAEVSAGVFIGFLTAFGSFQGAFVGLSAALLRLYAAQPLMERAKPILDAQPEASEQRRDPGQLKGHIEAAGLTFAYEAGLAPAIDRVDFAIEPGEHMAVVGPSGSGKSTLLRLLLGFETPQTGTILYDGQDLGHLELARVRRQIGVVLQVSSLFAGSILENIRGATEADLATCLDAAEQAGLARDLDTFAMGVHTPVTEGAATLSGGQRQRVLIARALAAKPNILFFDEATSALDNATQAIVAETLDSLKVTRVTIAHRLSTVRNADRICVLEAGRLVEQGTFDELMTKGGAFAELAKRQLVEGP